MKNPDSITREALFNEVKGSLFEYLVAMDLARAAKGEATFQRSLDPAYLTVLAQQDRMVRQFYPELGDFLRAMAQASSRAILERLDGAPTKVELLGKLSNQRPEISEADLRLSTGAGELPVSLKLNKSGAFVNTKSGGIRSFFKSYFPELAASEQAEFNRLVDLEFDRMARRLHELQGIEYDGTFQRWVGSGLSELPGELGTSERGVLKEYYARLSLEMHRILSRGFAEAPDALSFALAPLMGFSDERLLQVVCFHDFRLGHDCAVELHDFPELAPHLREVKLKPHAGTASVELQVGPWELQIRIKPMNKFTTTAVKINCSVKFRRPSEAGQLRD